MDKKIGIFTYMLSNYGAVLQCYALQKFLKDCGFENVEVIDFTTKEHIDSLKIFNHTIPSIVKRAIYNVFILSHYKELRSRRNRTFNFKSHNISFSRRYNNIDEVLSTPPYEDIYISGSDQVFNLNSKYYEVYYLGFFKGNSKKIAYAPSFGHCKLDDIFWNKIKTHIEDFDTLSCREESGSDFLTKHTNKEVLTVVDPTLLLNKSEWQRVSVTPIYRNKYILVYDLNGGDNLIFIAKELQKKYGFDIICITNNVLNRYKVNKKVFDAGPAEFIGWIANAECVITDSFHGTVFSIIYEKPFYTYIAIPELATRLFNLLKITALQNRIISDTDIKMHNYNIGNCNADYNLLNTTILKSKQFLMNSIHDEKDGR